ncbi:MAG: hypothetical protein J7K59_05535 [Candidatus Korarchaeota archaeon]|nr:hypothetical protein [Candidatus Korarchaeota archaeon]
MVIVMSLADILGLFLGIFGLLVLISLLLLWKWERLRKYKIWLKIRWRMGMSLFKHFYYDAKFYIKLRSLIKTIIIIGVALGFLLLIVFSVILLYNTYIATTFSLPVIELKLSTTTKNFNIFWIVSSVGGVLMSIFLKPKLEKFADKVNAKPRMIYIFGSNDLVKRLINSFVELGLGTMVALIADKNHYWIQELSKSVDLLILENQEELRFPTIYEKIKFKNALKVITLLDDPELNQHVILNVRRCNPEAEIIVLSRNKPPILDLTGQKLPNIFVIEDIDSLSREIIRQIALGFVYAPVIEAIVPPEYLGKNPKAIEEDFSGKLKVVGVKRNNNIGMFKTLKSGDKILLYLVDRRVLREFIHLIPQIEEKEESAIEAVKEVPPSTTESAEVQTSIEKPESEKEEKSTSSLLERFKKNTD